MIVITGAAGFIGSCLTSKLNQEGISDLILSDDFSNKNKNKNLIGKQFSKKVNRNIFLDWLAKNHKSVHFVFHIGARTNTTEFDYTIFERLNLNYSKSLWKSCSRFQIPFIYASSAATYGMGELGFNDNHEFVEKLNPLNPYGISKNEFDKWVLQQHDLPPFWAGFKFFNVYGPNEYHKGRMASVVFHTFNQIKNTGGMKLFKSHNNNYEDGKQLRDFIYIKDVINVLYFMMNHKKNSGLYNLGTGHARTFLDLAQIAFTCMNVKERISFIETPSDLLDKYQYFTEAIMHKLRNIGFNQQYTVLEEGIKDYIKNYLLEEKYY